MERILKLINSLNQTELQFIKNYYEVTSNKSKRSVLFNLLVEGKIASNSDALNLIYPGQSNANSALSHLKNKLFKELLNILMVTSPGNEECQIIHDRMTCKRNLLQSELLFERGLVKEGISILDKTSKIAEAYEYPDISLELINILLKHNIQDHNKGLILQSQKFIHNYDDIIQSKISFYYRNETNGNASYQRNKSFSKRAHFWGELSSIENLIDECKFRTGEKRALRLKSFLNKENCIRSNIKDAQVCKGLTEIYLNLGNYEEAEKYATLTHTHLLPYFPQFQEALSVVFFAYLRNGHYQEAETIYKQAISQSGISQIHKNKWILLRGALDFYQKKYKNVYGTIAQCDMKYINDSDWCLSPRFLELLSILELGDYEWYEFRLDCYRKKLAKLKMHVTDRMRIVFGLLQSLVKVNFNYDQLIKSEYGLFEVLRKPSPTLYWNPVGHELVNIPHWIYSKSDQFNFSNSINLK